MYVRLLVDLRNTKRSSRVLILDLCRICRSNVYVRSSAVAELDQKIATDSKNYSVGQSVIINLKVSWATNYTSWECNRWSRLFLGNCRDLLFFVKNLSGLNIFSRRILFPRLKRVIRVIVRVLKRIRCLAVKVFKEVTDGYLSWFSWWWKLKARGWGTQQKGTSRN